MENKKKKSVSESGDRIYAQRVWKVSIRRIIDLNLKKKKNYDIQYNFNKNIVESLY